MHSRISGQQFPSFADFIGEKATTKLIIVLDQQLKLRQRDQKHLTSIEFTSNNQFMYPAFNGIKFEDPTNYIKQEKPDLDTKHFSLRIIVKKDQQLDELIFVSIQHCCTRDIFEIFMSSAFWPIYVIIDAFMEKQSEKTKQTERICC